MSDKMKKSSFHDDFDSEFSSFSSKQELNPLEQPYSYYLLLSPYKWDHATSDGTKAMKGEAVNKGIMAEDIQAHSKVTLISADEN